MEKNGSEKTSNYKEFLSASESLRQAEAELRQLDEDLIKIRSETADMILMTKELEESEAEVEAQKKEYGDMIGQLEVDRERLISIIADLKKEIKVEEN